MPKRADAASTAAIAVDKRLTAAEFLQELLVDLIDLSLQGKQAHWNLRGPMFRPLHLHLDEIVDEARAFADEVAERCLALGVAADGRLSTLSQSTHLDPFPEGRIADHEVVNLVAERLHTISQVGRSRLEELDGLDLITQDLVIEVLTGIEKQLWMIDSYRA
jgi:starvation-inducible DNA-binding protein